MSICSLDSLVFGVRGYFEISVFELLRVDYINLSKYYFELYKSQPDHL